ncbi:hypothetical protein C8035_v000296 [Colletotrichum spinosum]|uniref:Uncharacterized protein n=1 Tax=Colletotrichum spinosum TaxID=1347390 RepID=A0A4R8PTA4_9PEZI|nr:hypothetical protein C8035_v000296 [Colletotrichum spinosum]
MGAPGQPHRAQPDDAGRQSSRRRQRQERSLASTTNALHCTTHAAFPVPNRREG